MKALISAVALGAFLAGPAFGEDAASIVQSLGQKWVIAYNAQDAAALAALYTKTALLLPQGVDVPLNGEAAIRKYFGDAVKQPVANMSIKATEGQMTGPDMGYGAGTWSADIPGQNGGAPTHIMGTFLSVVAHEGSAWKLQADTWNMMPPAQPQKDATK